MAAAERALANKTPKRPAKAPSDQVGSALLVLTWLSTHLHLQRLRSARHRVQC